jgi:hypothetical protein
MQVGHTDTSKIPWLLLLLSVTAGFSIITVHEYRVVA